jgi:hypothetical protein
MPKFKFLSAHCKAAILSATVEQIEAWRAFMWRTQESDFGEAMLLEEEWLKLKTTAGKRELKSKTN